MSATSVMNPVSFCVSSASEATMLLMIAADHNHVVAHHTCRGHSIGDPQMMLPFGFFCGDDCEPEEPVQLQLWALGSAPSPNHNDSDQTSQLTNPR